MSEPFTGQLVRQNALIESVPLQQDLILFHPRSNQFCVLNCTSSFIWNSLKSPMSPEQIADELSATFDGVTPADALKDVQTALSTLMALDLIITHLSER